MLSVKQRGIKYFGMTRPGTEPRSSGPLVNTLTIMPFFILKKFSSKDKWILLFLEETQVDIVRHYL